MKNKSSTENTPNASDNLHEDQEKNDPDESQGNNQIQIQEVSKFTRYSRVVTSLLEEKPELVGFEIRFAIRNRLPAAPISRQTLVFLFLFT